MQAGGTRVSGELLKVEQGKVSLQSPGIRETLAVPVSDLYCLAMGNENVAPPQTEGRLGRLEADGVSLQGCLTDSSGADSPLVWRPQYCRAGQPLAADLNARIVYGAQAGGSAQLSVRQQLPQGRVVAGVIQVNGGVPLADSEEAVTPRRLAGEFGCVLHLRYGDCVPCEVESIDENGLTFRSPSTDSTFVKHAQIQALELMPGVAANTIRKDKKERLLTLPRMQRNNPPTQLIRSVDGDYLRGQVLGMDEKFVYLELRLETKKLPRERIARILWLYSEDTQPYEPLAGQSGEPTTVRVQALENNGNRLTFAAERFEGSMLSGSSELLGACRVDVAVIDQLLIRGAIERRRPRSRSTSGSSSRPPIR